MEITNGWVEVTLSTLRNTTTLQNTTDKIILIKEADSLPTDNDGAFYVRPMETWVFVDDSANKFYVNGVYIKVGETSIIAVL